MGCGIPVALALVVIAIAQARGQPSLFQLVGPWGAARRVVPLEPWQTHNDGG